MWHDDQVRSRTTHCALVIAAVLLVACRGDGDSTRPASTPETLGFPVVLNSDTRVTAEADGSAFTEKPLADGQANADPAASPDDRRRVVVRGGQVVIQSSGGAEAVVVPKVTTGDERVNPVWSPDGARLMFDLGFDGSSALYVVAADGTGLIDLGAGLEGDAFPLAWAPDGQRLAFGLQGGGPAVTTELYVTRSDGSERAALGGFTNPQGDGGWDRLRFSPGGSKIVAFAPTEGLSLRVFDLGGAAPIDIASTGTSKFSWSPDGSSIAFDTYDAVSRRSTILVGDAASGKARLLTEGSWPRWSPAGDRIAFKRALSQAQSEVRTIRWDGSNDVVTGPPGHYPFQDLYWSDDGSELSFTRPAFGPAQLYRVDLADARADAIGSTLGDAGNPPQSVSVSPDERSVVFLNGAFRPEGGWYLEDLATRDVTLLASSGFPFADVHWTPHGPRIALGGVSVSVTEPGGSTLRSLDTRPAHRVVFSPDGSKLAVLSEHQLSIAEVDGPERRVLYAGAPQIDIVQQVDWAPGGQRLTYIITHSDNTTGATTTRSFVSDLHGNRAELTPAAGYAGLPYWSPDGKALAQVRSPDAGATREIWLMDDDGSNSRMLAAFDGYCCDPVYWSPDGSRIAVSHLNSASIVGVLSGDETLAVSVGGGCNLMIAGWSAHSDALYVYPACSFGI